MIEVSQVKIKTFQTVQSQYAILGISSSNKSRPFNERSLVGFVIFGCLILSQIVYIFHVANGFMDFLECLCGISASFNMFVVFVAIVFTQNTLFVIIDNTDILIDTSKMVLCLLRVL